jgi:hypothetical protein
MTAPVSTRNPLLSQPRRRVLPKPQGTPPAEFFRVILPTGYGGVAVMGAPAERCRVVQASPNLAAHVGQPFAAFKATAEAAGWVLERE